MKKFIYSLLGLLLLSSGAYAQNAPTFTSVPVTAAVEDLFYTYTAAAADTDVGDVLIYSSAGLPAWLTFDINTQVLSGTPGNDDVGDHPVTLSVFDGTFTVNQPFTITVSNVNDLPTFTSVPVTSVLQGALYTYTATATDIDVGDVLTYSAVGLPAWLNFDINTHILSGTPGNDDVGNHPVTLSVYDGTATVDQSFIIGVVNVNDPPTFTSTPVTSVLQGTLYTYTAVATDIDGDVLAYSAPVLPGWLTFDINTHILTGTPADPNVGNHNVTLRVSDGTTSVDQSFIIGVVDANDPPTFTSTPITTAVEDVLYSYTVTATDLDGDALAYSAVVLPPWLAFSTTSHILTGTPGNEYVGNHNVTLRIFDGTVNVDQTFVIAVSNVNDPPAFTSTPLTTAAQGSLYTYTATATDIDGDALVYSAPVLPVWLTFNTTTHVLTGTPGNEHVGNHNVTLRIFDGTVNVDQAFIIAVGNANDPPTFTSTPITTATEEVLYSYTATAEDLDGDALVYSAPVLPPWLTFNTTTHILTGTPGNEHVGNHNVTLRIFDGAVNVDQIFVIAVSNVNDAPAFTSTPFTAAAQGSLYAYTATAEDIDGDVLVYSAPVLPAWLTFNINTHILTGTPGNEHVGNHNVTLRIFDGAVNVDQAFIIAVGNANDAPAFTSTPITVATEEVLYSYTATAVDLDGDALVYSATVLPAWLTFNTTTHILTGTPGNEHVGNHDVTLRIFDGIVNVDQTFVIAVSNVNDAPTFTSTPVTGASQGSLYTYTATAEDIDGDVLGYSAPVLPEWLTFNINTHILTGTPGNEHVGNHNVTLSIYDGTVNVNQTFIIAVGNANDAPVITSQPVTDARPGSAYEYTIIANDPDGDALIYTAPVLPTWLNFNSSAHVLRATPGDGDVGSHNVTLRVSDGTLFVNQSFVIEVGYGNHAPTFTSDPETSAVVGTAYIYTIRAQDIDGDVLTYSAPLLPDWLTFYPATRVISGIPGSNDLGIHDVIVRISDGTVSADQSFPISVYNQNDVPTFTSSPVTAAQVGNLYEYTAVAEDLDDDQLTYSAPLLPGWLNFDINTHVLRGTPGDNDAGIHNVTIRVSDGVAWVDQKFVITVGNQTGVGTGEATSPDQLLIYPNPTSGLFRIELPKGFVDEVTLEILDAAGKVILQQVLPSDHQGQEPYDLSSQPAGIYFIRVSHPSGYRLGRLIIQ